jgi:hypothetical protein
VSDFERSQRPALTNSPEFSPEQGHGAPGTIESYQGRGVWVRPGLTARAILAGAKVIERECEVGHYTARRIAADVLEAVAKGSDLATERSQAARQRL